MPRARNIKPGFFVNDELAEIEPLGRLLFIGLWCIADREGRLKDRPKRIKAQVLPFDGCDVDKLLDRLHVKGFILRYEVESCPYIQVLKFNKHQNPHIKEQASEIPAPCKHHASTMQEQEEHETSPADSLIPLTDSGFPRTDYVQRPNSSPDDAENPQVEKSAPERAIMAAKYLSERIHQNNPRARVPKTEIQINKWAEEIDRLNRLGPSGGDGQGYSYDEIYNLIDFSQQDVFWQANILSAKKLREKITILENQMKRNGKQTKKSGRRSNVENALRLVEETAKEEKRKKGDGHDHE